MLRFVILRHEVPPSFDRGAHWDLLLEQHADLLAWSLPVLPQSNRSVPAEQLAAHRKAYLEYEGPVSGNRGHVSRWDEGTFRWLEQQPPRFVVQLMGRQLRGTLKLLRNAQAETEWQVMWHPETAEPSPRKTSTDGEPPIVDPQ